MPTVYFNILAQAYCLCPQRCTFYIWGHRFSMYAPYHHMKKAHFMVTDSDLVGEKTLFPRCEQKYSQPIRL